jgi:hypothetical protein
LNNDGTTVGSQDLGGSQQTGTATNGNTATGTVTVPKGSTGGLQSGPRGDITSDNGGLTVIAGSRDVSGNSEVAGFYGADTGDATQSQSVVGRWCATRPWASNFLGKIIPASFFDNICTRIGYTAGSPTYAQGPTGAAAVRPTVQLKQQVVTKRVVPDATSTDTVPAGKVQIWAVPAKVSLGSRTSVFWSTQNVTNCTETSPDGSFNQASLSGGASTVPITGPTTFSISCLDGANNPVTGFVTVQIKN